MNNSEIFNRSVPQVTVPSGGGGYILVISPWHVYSLRTYYGCSTTCSAFRSTRLHTFNVLTRQQWLWFQAATTLLLMLHSFVKALEVCNYFRIFTLPELDLQRPKEAFVD